MDNPSKDTNLKSLLENAQISQYRISKELGIDRAIINRFVAGNYSHAGKRNCRVIRRWLIEHEIIPKPKPRPPKHCWNCGCENPHKKKPV